MCVTHLFPVNCVLRVVVRVGLQGWCSVQVMWSVDVVGRGGRNEQLMTEAIDQSAHSTYRLVDPRNELIQEKNLGPSLLFPSDQDSLHMQMQNSKHRHRHHQIAARLFY